MAKAQDDSYKSYITFHVSLRIIQLFVEIGTMVLSIINVVVIILIRDSLDPDIAGLSVSLTLGLLGVTSFWSKTLVETGNFMTAPQRILEYADLPAEGKF